MADLLIPIKLFLSICCLSLTVVCDDFQSTLGHLKPSASAQLQAVAAKGVIERLIPDKAVLFNVIVSFSLGPEGRDTYQVYKDSDNGTVTIVGTSGVAACMGFHHYLKHYCNCHISWDGDQLALPDELPDVNITITTMERFRYYQNVCTTSYSFVWWNRTRWQREIDWMALNGINFPLAFTGQEAIWHRVYQKMNLSEEQIDEHFSGPAFLSWNRMGNMRGWGGPLPISWHQDSLILQHFILDSMRALGIIPILPAFAGHVPRAFRELFPDASMFKMGTWNHFGDDYCCPYLVDPTDPLFREVGNLFMSELIAEFGTDHAYNCDTFNEMNPPTDNVTYIADVGAAIFQSITDVDPNATWIIQGWLFENAFWQQAQARALLTSVPIGRMIVLDLQSDLAPQYYRLPSYYGQPFIWCMLHNFGGNLGMYGWASLVNKGLFGTRALNESLVGIGLTPEGINQNYVMYDLVMDLAWRSEMVNLTDWFSAYAVRRYGQYNSHADTVWSILQDTVYGYVSGSGINNKHVFLARPSLLLTDEYWYNTTELHEAWYEMLQAAPALRDVPTYQHDLVDLSRQCLQILATQYYLDAVEAYKAADLTSYLRDVANFMHVLDDMDTLLASSNAFLLGSWLNSAKAKSTAKVEKQLYEYNARNQVTLWGPKGEIVDYARKQWSGLVADYYSPRWQLFFNRLETSLVKGTVFNQTEFNEDVFRLVEEPFTFEQTLYPDEPQGDSVAISSTLYQRWIEQPPGDTHFHVVVV